MNPKKLARKVLPKTGIRLAEESYRRSRRVITHARYMFPARGARVIAVTGTNGKTTTCMLINSVLKSAGFKTAMFTTAVVEIAGKSEPNLRHTTVPLTADLLNFFRKSKRADVDFIVLEVTSHALQQHKLRGIPIEAAVLTNLSQEHLDYHGTMENYAAAKARLFGTYMRPTYCVLNRDDERYGYFLKNSIGVVSSYGQVSKADIILSRFKPTGTGSEFDLSIDGKRERVKLALPGEFNAMNATAAAAAAVAVGIAPGKIAKGLNSLKSVPGRMETIDAGQNFTVIVDYAVTAEALRQALNAARAVTKGNLHLVFGATGDRDRVKRPHMGEVAAKLADKVYLTDDETYTEEPAAIRREVMKGIKNAHGGAKTTEYNDRLEAIRAAFKSAKRGDCVLLTGIGHENYRNMGGRPEPWDERKVAKKLLKAQAQN